MDINKLNYEAYVIDYIEGQMNAEDKSTFDAFLLANPMIKEEIEQYMESPMISENTDVTYERKEQSKKGRTLLPWMSILLIVLGGIIYTSIQKPISTDNKLSNGQQEQLEYNQAKQLEHSQSRQLEQSHPKTPKGRQNQAPMASQAPTPSTIKNDRPDLQATSTTGAEKQAPEIKISPEVIASASATPPSPKPNSIPRPNESTQTSTIITSPSLASVNSEEVDTSNPINSTAPIESVTPIQKLNKRGLALLEEKNRRIELVVAINKQKRKSSNWKNLLVPQSFEEIDISQSFATDNLKSAARDVKEALIPESLITK